MKNLNLLLLIIISFNYSGISQWGLLDVDMPTGRVHHSAVAVDGKIIVAGGYLSGLASTNSVNIYDIDSSEWTGANLEVSRGLMGAVVHEDKAYFAGGGSFFGCLYGSS